MDKTHNILLVDDSEVNNILLASALKELQCNISVATSGKEALKLIEKQKFDLIILDIMMPGMSGIELLNTIDEKISDFTTPIIFVTASDYSKEVIETKTNIKFDLLEKPINLKELITKVKSILN